jgi:hypothetical protein
MELFKLLFPVIHSLLTILSWGPLEDIKENNQKLTKQPDNE